MEKLNKFIVGGAIFLGFISVSTYSKEPLKENIKFAGNSLIITNKFGSTIMYFHSDESYTQSNGKGKESRGFWRSSGDNLCLTVKAKAESIKPKEYCMSIEGAEYGKPWSGGVDPKNGLLTYHFIKGQPKLSDVSK